MKKFGGITAHVRSPAKGSWEKDKNIQHDDIVIIEVMTAKLNKIWWKRYKKKLETIFRQHDLIIRSQKIIVF